MTISSTVLNTEGNEKVYFFIVVLLILGHARNIWWFVEPRCLVLECWVCSPWRPLRLGYEPQYDHGTPCKNGQGQRLGCRPAASASIIGCEVTFGGNTGIYAKLYQNMS